MQSHRYELNRRDLVRLILPVMGVWAIAAGCLHAAAWLKWLPAEPTTLYADETVLRHQARARKTPHPAEIVIVGDSTCHAAVDAAALSAQLPGRTPVINLALVIGIDVTMYARIAADFAVTNPGQVRWVVLLVTPSRLAQRGDTFLWDQFFDDSHPEAKPAPAIAEISGGKLFRERLASQVLPQPLRGKGAAMFGFTPELDRFMTLHDGSVMDFGEMSAQTFPVPAEFPVGPDFAEACRDFRAHLPPGVKLAVGMTPSPARASGPQTQRAYRECLERLDDLLRPDALLTNLPVTLPTPGFSPSAHMNAAGQQQFTAALARELARLP
ncbi:MAG TPA: hypothetical protein VFZ59_25855 [Verrucomicrobiae bacterium]|nr:hypothetical protein [Verrucomicrobiae bacterium]